ncbi:DUF2808 domain-containing protein [Brunnivagina elsteri]|uniref:DUF2808 domain-containing protein n=1 Tax=Brunnivagina elsteri CCALA 953 TaxID=987040 RepID=A0A2A2TB59_9CYAN|nr:DUF2808 domain-containing protein [Calothrix elsteri]PAX49832.1 hypothetical protein CK510_27510 [Calothrix elsteri CCALA 953]
MRRSLGLLSALAVTGCLLTGFSGVSLAQSGINLWSGVKSENQLIHRFDFGGQANGWDRLRLRVPNKKLKTAVAQFVVSYPEYYNGSFDPKKIEVRVKGKSVPLQEAKWDKDSHAITIFPQEAIPAGNNVEIVLSNMRTPPFGGMYYFNLATQSPGDVPLSRYVGTYIVNIGS